MGCRTACCISVNCEHGQGHIDRWRTRKYTISKVQSSRNRWMNCPCLNVTTCYSGVQRRHSVASDHGYVLRIVIEYNDWLVDGQIESVRSRTARIVRPNRVGRSRHVHCWRTREHTINKVQSKWNRWMNRPCLNISTCNRWIQIGYRHASNKGQVLGVVVEDSNLFVDGQIDCVRSRTARIVRPNRVHRLGHVDRRCS